MSYREEPINLQERLFLDSTRTGHGGLFLLSKTGERIVHEGGRPGTRKNERRDHLKGQSVLRMRSGRKITIHYWEHPETGERIHLKFK